MYSSDHNHTPCAINVKSLNLTRPNTNDANINDFDACIEHRPVFGVSLATHVPGDDGACSTAEDWLINKQVFRRFGSRYYIIQSYPGSAGWGAAGSRLCNILGRNPGHLIQFPRIARHRTKECHVHRVHMKQALGHGNAARSL